jgi:hypothetical protein
MMSRTQITLEPEMQRRARRRASDLGVSLAEYLRGLLARDLGERSIRHDPALVFDLGRSGEGDIAANKDAMLAQAFLSTRKAPRRRRP